MKSSTHCHCSRGEVAVVITDVMTVASDGGGGRGSNWSFRGVLSSLLLLMLL